MFFKNAVAPDEYSITNEMQNYDVGLIPYGKASCYNYAYCSPNKLGQYMASLAVLANDSYFVGSVLESNSNGYTANFDDPEDLAQNVRKFIENEDALKEMKLNSKRGFEENFNWEALSAPVWPKIVENFQTVSNMFVLRPTNVTFPEHVLFSSVLESSPLVLIESKYQRLPNFLKSRTCCDLISYLELRPSSYDWNHPNLFVDFIDIIHANVKTLAKKPGFAVLCNEMINEAKGLKNLGVKREALENFKAKFSEICSYANLSASQLHKLDTRLATIKASGPVIAQRFEDGNDILGSHSKRLISMQDIRKLIAKPKLVAKIPEVLIRRFKTAKVW